MVEARLNLEPEVQEIFKIIDSGENFLLSGGAGSGKTYSLVQTIRQAIAENPTAQIACMTYTFAAVREIEDRINHQNLRVSTFHEFLWANIKHFQKELKSTIIKLANDQEISSIQIKIEGSDIVPDDYFESITNKIQYKEYLRISKGIISHDELLIVANSMFKDYPRLCDILKDKFKFIFIDEYQDTDKLVVEIFLNYLKQTKKQNIIGFFGDAMQSIYDNTIGNLGDYVGEEQGKVKEVKKEQNRRNPQKIIDLANIIRTDGLTQTPSNDTDAPNMENGSIKAGNIKFIHSVNYDIETVEKYLSDNFEWDFFNSIETKELNLTHNLIADKAGFRSLMNIYDKDLILSYKSRIKKYIKLNEVSEDFSDYTFGQVTEFLATGKTGRDLNAVLPTKGMQAFIDDNEDLYTIALEYNYLAFSKLYVTKDQLIDDKKQNKDDIAKRGSKRDYLIRHLFKIENNITLYQNQQYNEFLRKTDYIDNLKSIESKRILQKNIEELTNVGDKTIQEIILDAHKKGICLVDENLERFQTENKYIYDRVKNVQYNEFQKLYQYLEGYTPFSTQHKTKGAEFNNVLVILDNGNWNKYNFQDLFLNTGRSASVLTRTQKIFYVCCTRAKENLAVFYHDPSPEVIEKAIEWFGEENVASI